jgi:hypothetical protein
MLGPKGLRVLSIYSKVIALGFVVLAIGLALTTSFTWGLFGVLLAFLFLFYSWMLRPRMHNKR